EAVTREVLAMGQNCHPPLPASQCRDAVKTAFAPRVKGLRDQTIADWLNVTTEECEMLPARESGHGMPPASRYKGVPKEILITATETPQKTKAERHAAILKMVSKFGYAPPTRVMAEHLVAAGFPVNHVTVASDYKDLELETHQSRQMRQKRSSAEVAQKQTSI